jgi:hypothetical protein
MSGVRQANASFQHACNHFRSFNFSHDVIRLLVLMYARFFPFSLQNVEDLMFKRGIAIRLEAADCGGTGSARCSQATYAVG